MRVLTINIPDSLELNDREAKFLLVSSLFEKGKLTLGQAAEMVGLSKRAFMEFLGDYDVSIINHLVSEIDKDVESANKYCI